MESCPIFAWAFVFLAFLAFVTLYLVNAVANQADRVESDFKIVRRQMLELAGLQGHTSGELHELKVRFENLRYELSDKTIKAPPLAPIPPGEPE